MYATGLGRKGLDMSDDLVRVVLILGVGFAIVGFTFVRRREKSLVVRGALV